MKKILLVEDTVLLAEEISSILQLEKFSVTTVHSGLAALTELGSTDFDVIITDMLMPGMTGEELVRQVRNTPRLAKVPIIILSAKTSATDVRTGMDAGANAYITKPCKAHELVRVVKSLEDSAR